AALELHAVRIPGSRRLRYALLIAASLGAITLFLLAAATSNTGFFAEGYDKLVVGTGALVVLLMAIVGVQLYLLRRNYGKGVFGSRLAVRLVLLFSLVALLPRALDSGLNLGRSALDYVLRDTTNKASQAALALGDANAASFASTLSRAAEQLGISEAVLYTPTGGVLAVAGISSSTITPDPPPAAALRRARLQQPFGAIEQVPQRGLVARVVVPVNSGDR